MGRTIAVLFNLFLNICLFRKGPQDLPAAAVFLGICLILYILCSFFVALISQTVNQAVISTLVETLFMLFLTYSFLLLVKKTERWLQTVTAFCGTGIVFSCFAIPLLIWISYAGDQGVGVTFVSLIVLVLIVWNVLVMAHIIRHAFSIPFPAGILLSFAYIWMITNTIAMISAPPAV